MPRPVIQNFAIRLFGSLFAVALTICLCGTARSQSGPPISDNAAFQYSAVSRYEPAPQQPNPAATSLQQPSFRPTFESPADLPVSLGSLWMTDAETGLATYSSSLKFPLLRYFGSPPPIVKVGFDYTDLFAANRAGLPDDLYQYSIGVSTVRRLNEQWTIRSILGVGFATDNLNTSSDAWQFRGGVFGIKQVSPEWQFSVGAIALGRDDIPVVPAIGAVWTPSPDCRWDLILPGPKINFLIADDGVRQEWFYIGGGFDGTTWGYESPVFGDDRLTYSDLRVVAGWKSTPWGPPGAPFVRGRKYNVELGYSFSRDLEFNDEQTVLDLEDAFLFRLETSY